MKVDESYVLYRSTRQLAKLKNVTYENPKYIRENLVFTPKYESKFVASSMIGEYQVIDVFKGVHKQQITVEYIKDGLP